jgi:5-methylcytosine-specific restriction endonuclease McrA
VKKFCSTRCGNVARGAQLAEAFPIKRCALPECRSAFQPKAARQRCCSEKHGKLLYNRESRADGRQAMNAGDPAKRRARLRKRTQLRRALTRTGNAEPIDRDVVGERDGWKCGICRRKVNRKLSYPHRRSASLDHVVPLSQGGAHTYANARISHLECNNLRGNRGGGEQLALVG